MSVTARDSASATREGGGYAELAAEIRNAGLLRRRPWTYAGYFAANMVVLAGVVAAMLIWRQSWWLLPLAVVLAVVSTQIGFLGHDVGHLQVTRDPKVSRLLGLIDGNLLGGLSYGWWVDKHNAHHAHPNDLETDPDVRAGVFVFDVSQANERRGIAAWTTRHQAALFFPFLLGEAINLHVSSVRRIAEPGLRYRVPEGLLIAAHFVAYVALLATTLTWLQAVLFVFIHKGLQGIYLGCSFAPNHKGMPVLTAEQANDPLLRQVLTSRNIRGGPLTDFVLGGLNYQIEHHLFPSMPRPNLRHAQTVVRRFCERHEVSYAEASVLDSYSTALRHLHIVGDGLRKPAANIDQP